MIDPAANLPNNSKSGHWPRGAAKQA